MIFRPFSSDHSRIQTDQIFLDFMTFSETVDKNDTREILDYPIILETQ